MELRGVLLHAEWTPRDQNSEAGALTNGDFHDFDPKKRVAADFGSIEWVALDELMATGSDLYNAMEEAKASGKKSRSPARDWSAGGTRYLLPPVLGLSLGSAVPIPPALPGGGGRGRGGLFPRLGTAGLTEDSTQTTRRKTFSSL